jgi:hypothetical protein
MFSLTPKSRENASRKHSFGTLFGTHIGKMTILKRIKKTYKKHIENNGEMSPKRVPAKVTNLGLGSFWGALNDL